MNLFKNYCHGNTSLDCIECVNSVYCRSMTDWQGVWTMCGGGCVFPPLLLNVGSWGDPSLWLGHYRFYCYMLNKFEIRKIISNTTHTAHAQTYGHIVVVLKQWMYSTIVQYLKINNYEIWSVLWLTFVLNEIKPTPTTSRAIHTGRLVRAVPTM